MSFSIFEDALSVPRLGRYYNTISKLSMQDNDKEALALKLYDLNTEVAAAFYPILNNFEVMLRNNINRFLSKHFQSENWIIEQCEDDGYFSLPMFEESEYKVREEIKMYYEKLVKDGHYTNDKLVAKLSFGFWVHKFSTKEFTATNQTMHKSFFNRPKDTKQKDIFKDLHKILEFRNRIAHHEPVIFDNVKFISTDRARKIVILIKKFSEWVNLDFTILYDSYIPKLEILLVETDSFVARLSEQEK
jgi:Abi-like protein